MPGEGYPHANTVTAYFGGWGPALAAAGCERPRCGRCEKELRPQRAGKLICRACEDELTTTGHEMRRRQMRARIIVAMRGWHEHFGESPTCTEWSAHSSHSANERNEARREETPWVHAGTVTKAFGGWDEALRAAGLPLTHLIVWNLREARERAGLTQVTLAQSAGVSTAALQRWEKGGRMYAASLRVLAAILGSLQTEDAPKPGNGTLGGHACPPGRD